MRVLLIFIDGLVVGNRDPATNPCAAYGGDLFARFRDQGASPPEDDREPTFLPLDARLGVPGLPQSATGQTAILTGENAPALLGGRHLSGFPNKALREVLFRASVLRRLREAGRRAVFANAYRPIFFKIPRILRPLVRFSATTYANMAGADGGSLEPFRSFDDLRRGEAVFHDFTNRAARAAGFDDVPLLDPGEAGSVLGRIAAGCDFCLYEHFLTDKAGHACDLRFAVRLLADLDAFVRAAAATLLARDPQALVLVASDHGNIEDLTYSGHTENAAQGLLLGAAGVRARAAPRLRSLVDIAPLVLELVVGGAPPG